VNVQESKLPVALAMQVVGSLTLAPSKVKVMGLCDAKPLPPTASVLPTAPELGFRPMPGVLVLVGAPEFVKCPEAGFVSLVAAAFV
jgi:hypothetical protein